MRWMCSQRTRSADIGFSGGSTFLLSSASSAATTSSASTGLAGLSTAPGFSADPFPAPEPRVDHGKARPRFLAVDKAIGDRLCDGHDKAAAFHGAGEPLQ